MEIWSDVAIAERQTNNDAQGKIALFSQWTMEGWDEQKFMFQDVRFRNLLVVDLKRLLQLYQGNSERSYFSLECSGTQFFNLVSNTERDLFMVLECYKSSLTFAAFYILHEIYSNVMNPLFIFVTSQLQDSSHGGSTLLVIQHLKNQQIPCSTIQVF